MSECPPKKSEAELEADVDYMLDTIMDDIKSGKLSMSSRNIIIFYFQHTERVLATSLSKPC